jgi:hypothetical protein
MNSHLNPPKFLTYYNSGVNAYLAARYSRHEEMYKYALELATLGIGCTANWVRGDHEIRSNQQSDTPQWLRYFGQEDFTDVVRANVFIAFSEEPNAPGRQRGGRHVEFGIALALDIPILIIGPQENIFHHLPRITHVSSWEEAKNWLMDHIQAGDLEIGRRNNPTPPQNLELLQNLKKINDSLDTLGEHLEGQFPNDLNVQRATILLTALKAQGLILHELIHRI